MQLIKNSPIPLYQQLLNEIRKRIASGEWPADSQLPTEAELSAELGVSRVTIRQALGAAVDAGLVVRVAGKGTYVSNLAPIVRRQGFVGYVVPHLSHGFNIQMLLGVESTLKKEGYQLIFCNSESNLDEENRLLQGLESEGMLGYIVQPIYSEQRDRALTRFIAKHYLTVLLDRGVPSVDANLVASDHFRGGYAIVQHLIEQAYTDIRYLSYNPFQMPSISERFRGYEAAMADAGLAARPALVVGNTTERGFIRSPDFFTQLEHQMVDTIATFLRGPERPQAIVAMNDLYALLVFEAARREGLAVPDDLAVVGFDDLDFTASLNPPLTTVVQEPFRLGAEAAQLLLASIRGDSTAREIRLPIQIVVRSSSINPRLEGAAAARQHMWR